MWIDKANFSIFRHDEDERRSRNYSKFISGILCNATRIQRTRRITVTNLTDGFECSPKIFKRVCTKYIILTIHRLGEASFTSYED